jgi:uncharacterized protein YggE
MKHRICLTAAVAAIVLFAAPALAQIVPPAAISVTGEATVSVPPDLAQIDGGVLRRPRPRAKHQMPTTRRWARCCWR